MSQINHVNVLVHVNVNVPEENMLSQHPAMSLIHSPRVPPQGRLAPAIHRHIIHIIKSTLGIFRVRSRLRLRARSRPNSIQFTHSFPRRARSSSSTVTCLASLSLAFELSQMYRNGCHKTTVTVHPATPLLIQIGGQRRLSEELFPASWGQVQIPTNQV
jgi:hypothetical protein